MAVRKVCCLYYVRRQNSRMSTTIMFVSATPVLASLDIERSVEFFVSKLGFSKVHVAQGEYGIVSNGAGNKGPG
jgi:hypothetical protein